ncbi:MAG: type 4a pilus biogenesis protein PilO [Candidatus Thiodiazotropha sp. (ex Dulcina madagascariensis)]|nr:type 4a pilus biogenesis protein PilO [Candidatus Thiodiazotropha sp. (ex Dulcina madagascariensis)]MCU7925513.1 type 4a pilus biogenesis protein PilO [Candidatus Thiodiazotropha sp. (ex Dulcina madagascariensis)]
MKDFLETSDPRMVGMMLGATVLLSSAVLIAYLLWPQIKAFSAVKESHNIMLNVVNSSDGLEQQIVKVKTEVDSLAHQLHGDMAKLPAKQLESYIIGRLQKISWEADVELISVKPGVGQRVQMFQESLFEVEIHAGYFNFFNWLQTIGRELGFIVVKKYEINVQGKELHDPKLKIALTMVSYRRVQE